MSGAPGGPLPRWTPTPPERGSFPLDHFGDCKKVMQSYLECLKIVRGQNAPNCRLLAKEYLRCRMDNELMDDSDWRDLGLPLDEKNQSTYKTMKLASDTSNSELQSESRNLAKQRITEDSRK